MNGQSVSRDEAGAKPLPLAGMRVLEMTHAWAGPICGMMLADMGAEVIKVESPSQSMEARGGSPYAGGESVIFMMTHRNKKSVTIDVKSAAGRAVFLKLVRTADVLVQNMRPGSLKNLGLGYDDLKAVNPRLIYTSLSGYGHKGPDAHRAGVDQIAIAVAGLAATTMADASDTPVSLGAPVCDYMAAMWACHGTLSAYIARAGTGMGQEVDTSLVEAGLSLMISPLAMHFHIPGYSGYANSMNGASEFIRAGDNRYVSFFASYPALWERFVKALQQKELSEDERFQTRDLRTKNYEKLRTLLTSIFQQRPASHWVKVLNEAGVPVSLVNTMDEALRDPQVVALGMVQEQEHPSAGKIHVLGVPVTLSKTPGGVRTAAPLLGQHTEEVLASLGLSAEDLEGLRNLSVIGPRSRHQAELRKAPATEGAA